MKAGANDVKSNPRSTIICRNIMQACPENAISAITAPSAISILLRL
jgi:NAD-dependent dihydropyrimidine dehydrogenase PreA subunit